MATNSNPVTVNATATPWDRLTFEVNVLWLDAGEFFRSRAGGLGKIQFVRDDDRDGTMHLAVDFGSSDIVDDWKDVRFDFVETTPINLKTRFPHWKDNATVGAAWGFAGEKIISQMAADAPTRIEGVLADGQPVVGIYLPDGVLREDGTYDEIFLFTVLLGSAPDGGATGPPPPP